MAVQPAGQWVWVVDPSDHASGRWQWFVPGQRQDEGFDASRAGLYIGAFVALQAVFAAYAATVRALHFGQATDAIRPTAIDGLLALGFAASTGMFGLKMRGRVLEPVGAVSVFGCCGFLTFGLHVVGESMGVSFGTWVVLAVCAVVAGLMLVFPHPLLGLYLAVYLVVLSLMVHLPGSGVAVRALATGAALLLVAVWIESRTRSRTASALHYFAVTAWLVAKIAIGSDLPDDIAAAALLPLAAVEFAVALVWQRRSWSVSAWLTAAVSVSGLIDMVASGVTGEEGDVGYLAGLAVIGVAFVLHQRRGELARFIASELPSGIRPAFFAYAPGGPPSPPPASPSMPGRATTVPGERSPRR